MKVNSNVEFNKTINLPVKTIKVNSLLGKEELYFLERLQDQKKYKAALAKNEKSNVNYDITDIPMYIKDTLDITEVTNKVLKDIFIRNKIMNGAIVKHDIWLTNGNNLLKTLKDVEEENSPEKTNNKKNNIFKFANVKEKERANNIVKARIFTRKKLEEAQRYELVTVNRLGTVTDYTSNFYSTLKPEFEGKVIDNFFKLYKQGKIYKESKPVYWCSNCKSSSERVKYEPIDKEVVYALYRIKDDHYLFAKYSNLRNTYFVGTTISPWTMVYSDYLVIVPEQKYSLVEVKNEFASNHYIIAENMLENVMKDCGINEYKVLENIQGEELKWCMCQDPLDYTKNIAIIGSKEEYVIPDKKHSSGIRILSNCHSYIDYLIYTENRLEDEIKNILDMKLKTSSITRNFQNMYYKDVSNKVIEYLQKGLFLLGSVKIKLKTPKCTVCNEELVYRIVNEWYIKKDDTTNSLKKIEDKIVNLKDEDNFKINDYIEKLGSIKSTQISEEKLFGIPIPIFYCGECGNIILNETSMECIKKIFNGRKTEEWYKMTPEDILQKKVKCDKCGCDFFFKEETVLNDFFKMLAVPLTIKSGYEDREGQQDNNILIEPKNKIYDKLKALSFSLDIDEQIEQITKVLIHGISDKQENALRLNSLYNKKDSKAEATNEEQQGPKQFTLNDVLNNYGTDILRLWISHKYKNSRIGIKESEIKYEKTIYNYLRMTVKFLLSNLQDFNPNQDYIDINDRTDLDKYIYIKLSEYSRNIEEYYENLKISKVYDEIVKFSINTLCRSYFDSLKYRLYILKKNNKIRLSTLSTFYDILMLQIKYLEPIVPFFIEEAWPYVWVKDKGIEKNVLLLRDKFDGFKYAYKEEYEKWNRIYNFKAKVKKVLGHAQKNKIIGNTLQAKLIIHTNPSAKKFIEDNFEDILRSINVSQMEIEESSKEGIKVEKADGVECARCKNYAVDIGKNLKYRYLCPKCADIMEEE